MKKLISLILVVLLCLPTVFVTVSAEDADTYTITAASGANTTSNDYLNVYKYLTYYNGGDIITIPENYITVGQWKANIANPAINANGVADDAYVTSDCTLTFTMDDGVTTKNVEIDAVNYNQSFKKYDKKQSTTYAANDFGLTYGKGSKATVTVGNKIVSGSDYGLTMDVEVPSDATNMQGYVNVIQKLDTVKSITTPYIIDMTFKPESIQSLYRVSVGFMNSAGNGRAMSNLPNAMTNTIKASENVNISMVVFPKAGVMDIYVNGSLALENKNINDTTNSTTYADYNRLFVRFYNGTKVNNVYENLTFTITDYEIRSGYGKIDSPLYIAPEVEFLTYANGANVKVAEVEDITATVNDATYNTAELYVNGSRVSTGDVTNKAVTFASSYLKPGTNELEVIMYKNGKKPVSTGKITVNVQGDFIVEGISEGLFIHPDDFTGLVKVTANAAGFNKAELYIDGTLKDTVYVSGTEAYLNAGTVEVGKYAFEVRLYPVAGEYLTKTYNVELSTLSASEIFEFEYTADADETSDVYKNISKYVAYMEEELNIPKNYITVGQWKANISNPAIVAEGLSDDDYITDGCSLVWIAADGVTTKNIDVYTAQYNYTFKKYDNTETIKVNNGESNDIGFFITMGTNGVVTTGNTDFGDGTYAVNVDMDNFTGTTNPWNQVRQNVSAINQNITTPYMMEMTVKFNDAEGLSSADFGFLGASKTAFDGKQRAAKSISGFTNAVANNNEVKVAVMVYPKAQLADIYLNDNLVIKNHSLVQTNDLGTSYYEDYSAFFIRFYNVTKVDGEYKKLNYDILSYQIKYGYGNLNDDVYVAPEMDFVNYQSGASLTSEELEDIEVVTNSDDFVKAVLYVDGVAVDTVEVTNKSAVLDMSMVGYGEHNVEVRLYPEIGEYISNSLTFRVADPTVGDSFVYDFEDVVVGEAPSKITKPITDVAALNFINISQPGLNDPTVIVNDAVVEYYDEVRGNVLHAKAGADSDTSKDGRRIEFDLTAGVDAVFSLDFMMDCFSDTRFITVRHYNGDTAGEHKIVEVDTNGALVVNGQTLAEIDINTWYTIEAYIYANMGGLLTVNLYDENGQLINTVETVYSKLTDIDTLRCYIQYNRTTMEGERYIDNVSVTTVYSTGAITNAKADTNTVTVALSGVDSVDDVKVTGSEDVALLGYSYNMDDGVLTITTSQPLNNAEEYLVSVYADGNAVPLTSGFEIEGEYIKVKDSYFTVEKDGKYVVLNVDNKTEKDGKITVLVSQWDGDKFISMNAKTITVAAGVNKYNLSVEDIENVKIMPVISLTKPILLSKGVIEK
ncbi:MAG: hypothetical protein IKV86_06505 [Clostridia bacterium]|nr:hypothetical protein [Clostridia bacterium]